MDTGKLYHHKMRLDSVLRKPSVSKEDVLNYIKTKHYLYFVSGKVTDQLLYKFIDKILLRQGKISKVQSTYAYKEAELNHKKQIEMNDFEYLNDEEEE